MGNTNRMIIAGLVLAGAPFFTASASDIDGKNRLLCNFDHMTSCPHDGGECVSGAPEEGNMPEFIEIDFAGKKLSGLWPKTQQRVSKLSNLLILEDRIVGQGIDDDRPWSFVVDRQSGNFVGAGPAMSAGVNVFGDCMPMK